MQYFENFGGGQMPPWLRACSVRSGLTTLGEQTGTAHHFYSLCFSSTCTGEQWRS